MVRSAVARNHHKSCCSTAPSLTLPDLHSIVVTSLDAATGSAVVSDDVSDEVAVISRMVDFICPASKLANDAATSKAALADFRFTAAAHAVHG